MHRSFASLRMTSCENGERIQQPPESLLLYVGVEHAFLFQVVRHRVLGQKRRLEPDFGANPFALPMGRIGRMIAASSAAKLWAEVGGLNLVELIDLTPGGIAYRTRDIDF